MRSRFCSILFSLLSAKPTPGMDAMLDHIESIAELVGIDHVAIGTDWPMQLPKWVLTGPFKMWTLEVGFSDEQVPSPEQNLIGFDDYLRHRIVGERAFKHCL